MKKKATKKKVTLRAPLRTKPTPPVCDHDKGRTIFIYVGGAIAACGSMMGIMWLIGYKIGVYNCFCGGL